MAMSGCHIVGSNTVMNGVNKVVVGNAINIPKYNIHRPCVMSNVQSPDNPKSAGMKRNNAYRAWIDRSIPHTVVKSCLNREGNEPKPRDQALHPRHL